MLIDTCALLWYAFDKARLSERAAGVIREPETSTATSAFGRWQSRVVRKLVLRSADGQPTDAKQFVLRMIRQLDLRALPLEFNELADVEGLPPHHKDPFDRLLVVQAKHLNIPLFPLTQSSSFMASSVFGSLDARKSREDSLGAAFTKSPMGSPLSPPAMEVCDDRSCRNRGAGESLFPQPGDHPSDLTCQVLLPHRSTELLVRLGR